MGKPPDGFPAVFPHAAVYAFVLTFLSCAYRWGWVGGHMTLTFAGIKRNGLGQTFIYLFVITTNALIHVPLGINAKMLWRSPFSPLYQGSPRIFLGKSLYTEILIVVKMRSTSLSILMAGKLGEVRRNKTVDVTPYIYIHLNPPSGRLSDEMCQYTWIQQWHLISRNIMWQYGLMSFSVFVNRHNWTLPTCLLPCLVSCVTLAILSHSLTARRSWARELQGLSVRCLHALHICISRYSKLSPSLKTCYLGKLVIHLQPMATPSLAHCQLWSAPMWIQTLKQACWANRCQ